MPSTLTIFTWNINQRPEYVLDPVEKLAPHLDIVTLQEVTLKHAPAICKRLHEMGYSSMYTGHTNTETKYGNVIAARTPVKSHNLTSFDFPIPQLAASVQVETPAGPITVVTVHVPNGSEYGWRKIDTFDALKRLVLKMKGQQFILTGDFNEPDWVPLQSGHIVTFGQTKSGRRWIPWNKWRFNGVSGTGERWDAAVRWFFESRNESGLRVAFWAVDSRAKMAISHRTHGPEPRRWFDHIFVSSDFKVRDCKYLHSFRNQGFSDHSPLIATLSRVGSIRK